MAGGTRHRDVETSVNDNGNNENTRSYDDNSDDGPGEQGKTKRLRRRANVTASASRSASLVGHPHHLPRKTSSSQYLPGPTNGSRAVWVGRLVFIVCLVSAATILGLLAFHFLTEAEAELAEKQFDSIASRAVDAALGITHRKRLGTVSMATVVSFMSPDAEAWPFVKVDGFQNISKNIIETSDGQGMGVVPLVRPDQLENFTDFVYDYYEELGFPNTTGTSPFGKGVWAPDASGRYEVTDESTGYEGRENDIICPLMLLDSGPHSALMLNMYYETNRGAAIDELIACSEERELINGVPTEECNTALTDVVILNDGREETTPGALLLHPINPANNQGKMTGFLASSIQWKNILKDVFPNEVNGIDCVLDSGAQTYTYHVVDGNAVLKGEGDLHQRKFSRYKRLISLTGNGGFTPGSPQYTLTLYPSSEFFAVYSTPNPFVATIGAVCIIALTSILFLIYDTCVRREFSAKRDLLESKRKFVRFVSHEVRTPLNSVCMGLTLMQEEMEAEVEAAPESYAAGWLNLAREVYANTQSSVDVLNDLLNYDKIEMGNLSLELTVIPIWKLIQKTAAEFKLPATKKMISLDIQYDNGKEENGDVESGTATIDDAADNQLVVGDTVRLTQVLRNLLSNALKFTPEGGQLTMKMEMVPFENATVRSITLSGGKEVECSRCGFVNITVKDTGAGMSPEQVKKLFRNGIQFNVNELQAGQGSGLGLFIARGIMEQHGGTLTASSEGLGKGTTFTMRMPIYDVPDLDPSSGLDIDEEQPPSQPEHLKLSLPSTGAPVAPSTTNSSSPLPPSDQTTKTTSSSVATEPAPEDDHAPLHILIVDDAAMNRKLLRRLLQRHGHICEEAEDGHIAVDIVAESLKTEDGKFDAILLDFEMPVMNGPVAAKKIRAMGCDAFIVGITGNVLPEDVSDFKSSGANGVLSKPFKLPELDQLWAEFGMGRSIVTKRSGSCRTVPSSPSSPSRS